MMSTMTYSAESWTLTTELKTKTEECEWRWLRGDYYEWIKR